MTTTLRDYLNRAMKCAAGVDAGRWELAKIAAEMRDTKIDHWAAKLAALPNVRREPRTMREWAQTADFRHSLRRDFKLPFSFFAVASRLADRIELTTLEDALEVCEGEAGITHEAFAAQLRDMAGNDADDVRRALRQCDRMVDALGRLLKLPALPRSAYDNMGAAQERLIEAAAVLEQHVEKLGSAPLQLQCQDCGQEEREPSDVGDACVCGGIFALKGATVAS